MNSKTDTLLGGRYLTVLFNDETTRELIVRQIKVGEYQRAFPLISDELKLVAFATGLTEAELNEVNPEHYEALRAAVWEVNAKGFFFYAARQRDANQAALKELPPEALKALLEKIASTLRMPSPTLPPTRA